ncbi:RNA polymerase sigma factor [Marinomonas balearica]|uniref:RNA polymerase sigma-70 factor (ECF subfamily) n=1 Tax=Marinomonas balearica TaxID=491947 RepID=A0A4R6M744_9GAMM|nr:sigma-70 family RNA polymerase sigma factor [Marinomonas balearica]TDO96675.1 RNA polymerase sigma-70 factor (ECF subfamily) [Marinomonas balearica]
MLNKYSVYNSKNTESNQFWALWFEHQPRLRSCCLRWLNGNHALVDDALSQAVEKTHNYYLKQHSEIRSPFSWFCKVTHNICIDIHREHKKQNNLYTQITEDPNQYYFSEYESEELEEQIERESQLECLYKALDGMKTEFKLAIKYRFIDEMEYSEIANILETTPENIRKRVQLARKELRLMAA